jgi:integrase
VAGKRRTQGEGSVYFDSSRGRWVGQAWIAGSRRKVSGRTKADAAAALGRLVHGDEAERHADRRGRLSGLLADWQAQAIPNRKLAPATVEAHAWACALWTARLGSVRLAELDVVKVERALAAMAEDRLSRASLVKARSTLRQALAWAQRRRLVTYNAATAAELPTDAKGARARRALTAGEVKALLAEFDEHPWQAMYALMARVGLRPGEAAGVCADAIDLDSEPPTVAVIRAVHLERGRPVLTEALKTAGARRTLAIPADVAEVLKPLSACDGLLFTAEDGGPVWPSTARSELVEACTAAEVPKVSPNELRHSAATILADSGLSPHQVADILGHRTTRMVDEVYRHRPPIIRGAER